MAILLDARDPALDHHRPGGLGLFGTAMGVETMAAAARAPLPDDATLIAEQITVGPPCILPDGATHRLELHHEPLGWTSLSTPGAAIHFRARFSQSFLQLPQESPPAISDRVTAAAIYRLFFHGPAFRVIAAATYAQGVLTARGDFTQPLIPPWTWLMELGLQSAGLCELAATGRMMIPRAITRVIYGSLPPPGPVTAQAQRSAEGFTITIQSNGRTVMQIENYQTTPLPFASDATAAAELAARLQPQERP